MKFWKKFALIALLCLLVSGQALEVSRAQDPQPDAPDATWKGFLPIIKKRQPAVTISANPVFGVEMGSELDNKNDTGPVDMMADAGASWVRYNGLLWSTVEPSLGQRKWDAAVDTRLSNASKFNLTTLLVVRSTPAWAQKFSGYPCGPMKQEYFDEFANFMKDVVARYSQAPYNVLYYELWNEPDVSTNEVPTPDYPWGCWGDPNDTQYYGGAYYADMLKVVVPAMRQANPNVQVVVGGLLLYCNPNNPPSFSQCIQSKYLNGILANGGGPYFEGVSYHAYDYFFRPSNINDLYNGLGVFNNNKYWLTAWNTTGPSLIAKTNYLKGVLSQYGASNKYLIASEIGLVCGQLESVPDTKHCDAAYSTSAAFQNTKAIYVVEAYTAGRYLNLKSNIWYSWWGWSFSGLYSGSVSRYEPGYYAYDYASGALNGATSAVELGVAPDVKGYEFRWADRKVWVLWYVGGDPANGKLNVQVNMPSTPLSVYRWVNYGTGAVNQGTYQPATVSASLAIGREPVFITMTP